MAPPRKPTNVLALTGAFKHNAARARLRADEPTPGAPVSDEPPLALSELESIAWREIVAKCPPGVLADADEALLELTAKLLAAIRYGEPADLIKHAAVLVKCLGLLGMSPADRSRVKASKPVAPDDDPDAEFFGPSIN